MGHTFLKDGFEKIDYSEKMSVHFIDGPPYYLIMQIENVLPWELFKIVHN